MCQQRGEVSCRLQDLLAVVDQEQRLLSRKDVSQRLQEWLPSLSWTPRVMAIVARTSAASHRGVR